MQQRKSRLLRLELQRATASQASSRPASMYGYLHLALLPRRARRIACSAHSAYQPSSVQTSLAWPWLWIFALSLRVFAFVFYSVSPLSHRLHDVHRGQPLRCQSQFRNLTRVTLPTNDPTATDDDGITRAADERHLRLRIDPAEYWPCDPGLLTQSAARNLYLHRRGDNCESERQAPAYREHFLFLSRLSYLYSLLRRPTERHAVTASAGRESTSYLARLSLDLHLTLGPACLPPIYATRLGIILSQLVSGVPLLFLF